MQIAYDKMKELLLPSDEPTNTYKKSKHSYTVFDEYAPMKKREKLFKLKQAKMDRELDRRDMLLGSKHGRRKKNGTRYPDVRKI